MPHSSSTLFVSDFAHPLIRMVTSSVNVLADVDGQRIMDCLNDKVYPRIRLALISAKNATSTDTGVNVFLGADRTLESLKDSSVQQEIDDKLNAILDGVLLQEPIYQVAAAMAAGYLLLDGFQAVEFLYKTGWDLIKQANKDLADLVNGPLYKQAVDALLSDKTGSTEAIPQLYLAPAANPATYDETSREAGLFEGAQEDGTAILWVGQTRITVDVLMGDTYLDIMYKLLVRYRGVQTDQLNSELPLINLALGVDEGTVAPRSFNVALDNGDGTYSYKPARVNAPIGYLSVHALNYDNLQDAMALTLELGVYNADGTLNKPGIEGIVFGTSLNYNQLTAKGPHSLIYDIKTGKATATASTKTTAAKLLADTFYFQLRPEPGIASFTVTGPLMANETLAIRVGGKTYTYTCSSDNYMLYLDDIVAKLNRDSVGLFGSRMEAARATGTDTVTLTWYAAAAADAVFDVTLTAASATLSDATPGFLGYHVRDVLGTEGVFVYRTGPLTQTVGGEAPFERTVAVTAGKTLIEALQALLNDIYANQANLRLAAAMRSPVILSPDGMPVEVPSVQFVPYLIDSLNSKIVFDLLTVPEDVLFAPRPATMVANQNVFDNRTKSLVLDPVVFKRAGAEDQQQQQTVDTASGVGRAYYAAPAVSPLLERMRAFDEQARGRLW